MKHNIMSYSVYMLQRDSLKLINIAITLPTHHSEGKNIRNLFF